jgi:hypothetical protein
VPKRVYDFVDAAGQNLIDEWLASLDKGLLGRVRGKLYVLLTAESDLPPHMLTDTAEAQIKELRINSTRALRLLLCKGPEPKLKNEEFTLLFGAAERDKRYVPRDALARAESNRQLVLQKPTVHRTLREKNGDPRKA